MKHPFINDLSDKSLDELQETISGLTSKLTFAYRTQNAPLVQQLQMALESYRSEYNTRMDELIAKQNIKTKIDIKNEHQN